MDRNDSIQEQVTRFSILDRTNMYFIIQNHNLDHLHFVSTNRTIQIMYHMFLITLITPSTSKSMIIFRTMQKTKSKDDPRRHILKCQELVL